MTLLAIFIVLVFLYSLVSGYLERTVITAPILFTAAGMAVLLLLPELRERKGNLEVFLRVAEVGLVLLLFTDASRTDLQVLKSIRNLPVRLLSTGMLLTIVLGLVYFEHGMNQPGASTIGLALMVTVLLSIFAHGLSAMPGIQLYAAKVAALEAAAPEHEGGPTRPAIETAHGR